MGNRHAVYKKNIWINFCLLLFWILLGLSLRFTNLAAKPPWADEWATLVFSLGNSFKTVPLEQIISLDTILQPVTIDNTIKSRDVILHLMDESTHPPFYFLLTHWWLKLFPSLSALVSLWQARSLSALLGVLAIPATFGLTYLWRSCIVTSQIAAALMAVSPYGIYLAQEARHYTLAILWIIASLACAIATIKHLQKKSLPPIAIIWLWIVVNSLAVATHYFFVLSLIAQIIVLSGFWLQEANGKGTKYALALLSSHRWRRVGIAILGTFIGCLGWIWAWKTIPDDRLTEWVYQDNALGGEFFAPIPRLLGWIVTMLMMVPIQNVPAWVIVVSVAIVLPILGWLAIATIKNFYSNTGDRLLNIVVWYLLASVSLILGFTYIFDRDLTLAARFQFFYFPSVLLAIATVFAQLWRKSSQSSQTKFLVPKTLVILTLLLGCCGSISIVSNLAYQKPDRPDLVVPVIADAQRDNPEIPTVIATVHKTHEQTGEIMGLAWEWQKLNPENSNPPQFLLLHKEADDDVPTRNLNRHIEELSRPVDVWVVNFSAAVKLESQNCAVDEKFNRLKASGYRYRLYHCY